MKDHEARFDIGVEKFARQRLEAKIALLEEKLATLTVAYDALFDVVAADLGYEAKADKVYLTAGVSLKCSPDSPRQFEKTKPQSELVRVPARFKKG